MTSSLCNKLFFIQRTINTWQSNSDYSLQCMLIRDVVVNTKVGKCSTTLIQTTLTWCKRCINYFLHAFTLRYFPDPIHGSKQHSLVYINVKHQLLLGMYSETMSRTLNVGCVPMSILSYHLEYIHSRGSMEIGTKP